MGSADHAVCGQSLPLAIDASQSDVGVIQYRLSIFNNLEEVVMDMESVYEMDVDHICG
jgi:hypothetical protein